MKARNGHTGNFWYLTARPRASAPVLTGELTCDVLVVGAGFTELRAALELAVSGVNTIVCDADDVGHGASGRSVGQVNPMLPVPDPWALRFRVGPRLFAGTGYCQCSIQLGLKTSRASVVPRGMHQGISPVRAVQFIR